ncbi:hypothetical protein ACN28I_28765 [Archangium gephyra]|uniref:hypothetical protein n=1 Tax=Archangium gephyra TaxID=48 RepID=UPI003B78BDCF
MTNRIHLMRAIGKKLGRLLPGHMESFWVYPGGFFGFDAHRFRDGEGELAWTRAEPFPASGIDDVIRVHPSRATIAFGADNRQLEQRLFCCGDSIDTLEVLRSHTDLVHRKSNVGGGLTAAFFVCGEFTGSSTTANGPFFGNRVLKEPASELHDCDLLVDLAHSRVRRTIYRPPMHRQVHQLQMLRFTQRGTALLAHHHGGHTTQGRPTTDCSPYWIAYQGSAVLDDEAEIIPIEQSDLP